MLQKQGGGRVNADYLKLSLLRLRANEDLAKLEQAKADGDKSQIKFYQQRITRSLTEMMRRVTLALAVFTFTLMGAAFGINISRKHSYKGVVWVVVLAALFMVCFFTGKGLEYALIPAALLYTAPHVIIIASSVRALHRVSKGVE